MEFKEVKKVKGEKYDEDSTQFTYSVTFSNGQIWSVPNSTDNRHYKEIQRQVKEGTLTIKDAE